MPFTRPFTTFIGLAFGVSLAIACGRVHAQVSVSPELDDATLRARITTIQGILDERAGRAQLWQYGWVGLGYAAAGGFATLAATTSDDVQRLDFAFAAGGALVDTTVHALGSIEVHAAARVRERPEDSVEHLRLKLAFAQAQLEAAAEAERDRQTFLKAQVLPVGFAVATGLVLGAGFGHWRGAAVNTLAAIVINELRVFSQPTSSIDALQRYRDNPDAALARLGRQRGLTLQWAAGPTGCALYGTF